MDSSILAAIMGMGAAVLVISLIMLVLLIVAGWRIFEKAGEAGWKIFIPVYNAYTYFKISNNVTTFWVYLVLSVITVIVCSILSAVSVVTESVMPAYIANILMMLFYIAAAVISIIQCNKLSKAFGCGVGFTIGLILLNPIFSLILAFNSNIRYVGQQAA